MTEKIFTEEQYQAIAKAGDKAASFQFGLIDSDVNFEYLLQQQTPDGFNAFYPHFDVFNQEIMAIANPATRQEAKEKFVEKEKKYYWTNKKKDNDGDTMYLYRIGGGSITSSFFLIRTKTYQLTESEIREWGYNPDMFDREEVE